MQGAGCRVKGVRSRVQGGGVRAGDFKYHDPGLPAALAPHLVPVVADAVGAQGSGFRVQGSGFRVQVSGFTAWGLFSWA